MKRFTRRDLANLAGLALALYLGFMVVKVVLRNHDLQQQIGQLKTQIAQLQDQKAELAYKIQYYQTDSFKEKAARAKLDLQAPGEGVIILPHAAPAPTPATSGQLAHTPNPRAWWDFLFGKG